MRKKAKDIYKNSSLNCAQAILHVFQKHFEVDDEFVHEARRFGGGRAPGNVCGAYYAAILLLKKHCPEKIPEFEKFFLENVGSLKCFEIKRAHKVSCEECIEKADQFLLNSKCKKEAAEKT